LVITTYYGRPCQNSQREHSLKRVEETWLYSKNSNSARFKCNTHSIQ